MREEKSIISSLVVKHQIRVEYNPSNETHNAIARDLCKKYTAEGYELIFYAAGLAKYKMSLKLEERGYE